MAVKLISDASSHNSPAAPAGPGLHAPECDAELNAALQVLGRLQHPNLASVQGACSWGPGQRLVLEERCACSLAQVLYGRRGQTSAASAAPQRLPLTSILKVTGGEDWGGQDLSRWRRAVLADTVCTVVVGLGTDCEPKAEPQSQADCVPYPPSTREHSTHLPEAHFPSLAPPLPLQLAIDVFSALSYLHSLGVLHRDVNPNNVLINGPHAKLSDVGVWRHKLQPIAGSSDLFVGTLQYMAPECFSTQIGKVGWGREEHQGRRES